MQQTQEMIVGNLGLSDGRRGEVKGLIAGGEGKLDSLVPFFDSLNAGSSAVAKAHDTLSMGYILPCETFKAALIPFNWQSRHSHNLRMSRPTSLKGVE